MAPISVPIASRLPSSLRIAPTNATVTRVLSRLSRPALLSLALDWLDEGNQSLTSPYLRPPDEDEDDQNDDFYPPATSREALQEHYTDLQNRKGSKRDVLDRILEGDWRHGLSLYQLAMADLQHLYDHPTSQKWTAFQIVPLKAEGDSGDGNGDTSSATAVVDKASLVVPRFHPSSFLRNLQAQILPDIKVHYNFDRHKHLPLLLLRIFILDSPYNTSLAAAPIPADPERRTTDGKPAPRLANIDSSRTIYIAFPDASPFIYLSSAQSSSAGGERAPGPGSTASSASSAASLRTLVVEAIPKALSQAHERYALKPTNMATRNLTELLQRRGAGRTNTAGGGWSIYADEKTTVESPLSTLLPASVASRLDGTSETPTKPQPQSSSKRAASPGTARSHQQAKRRKQVAVARFGPSAKMGDGCGVERVDIVMQDPFPGGRRFDFVLEQEEAAAVDNEDSAEASEQAPAQADRRRSKGGRRSQIDAVLALDEEEAEEEEARQRDAARKTASDEQDEEGEGEAEEDKAECSWRPRVALTFHGPHIFAGIRQLVEAGVIDGEKMPGWMTGEEGVTVGAVRHGRIRGHKGSGMP
ncbi:chromosome loss-related protein [Sporothrix bragantina]|uniref:Chromosome loss-related protein n=1 Tax=Sporothrix bragantina TaxID=671064 RepID=A0ABP0C9Q0_9PEZI